MSGTSWELSPDERSLSPKIKAGHRQATRGEPLPKGGDQVHMPPRPSPSRGSPRRTRSLCTAGPRSSLGRSTHRLGPPTPRPDQSRVNGCSQTATDRPSPTARSPCTAGSRPRLGSGAHRRGQPTLPSRPKPRQRLFTNSDRPATSDHPQSLHRRPQAQPRPRHATARAAGTPATPALRQQWSTNSVMWQPHPE